LLSRSKGIKENIKLSNAILSRFDLIFLMLDQPDPNRDQKLSAHVMKLHNSKRRKRDEFENGREEDNPIMTLSQFQQNFKLEEYTYKRSVMKNNQKNTNVSANNNMSSQAMNPLSETFEKNIKNNKYQSLSDKYIYLCDQISPNQILDPFILRKYISFVKKNSFPR
jgi:DNA replicative helicase MCM subunit Mcm2 (Cdc46/Mcm family)